MDGLGLVYEKQGNTGAAAYNQPSLQYGQTPLDAVAQNIEQQNLIKQQQEFQLAKQREKEKAAVLGKLGDINLSKFTLGNQQEFMGDILNHKNQIAADMSKGEDVTDPTSPAYARTYERQLALQNKKMELDKQGAIIEDAMKILQTKPDDFDVEKSAAAIKAYAEAPNATERMKIDPSTLLVRKAKPFDTYAPLKDFKIDTFVGSFGNETPTGGSSGTTLNKANLKKEMEAIAENPVNDEHYQEGVQKGLWNSKREYADALYNKAILSYSPKFQKSVKAINGPTDRDFLMTAGVDELRKRFGLGDTTAEVFSGSGANAPQKIKISNAINIGDIKATVPYASAIDATTGNTIEGQGAIEVKSGQMSTPLVFNATDKIVAIPNTGSYSFKDTKTGETKEYKGTQKQIEAQLIRNGYAKYKPMLLATYKDDVDQTRTAWVPASALPTTNESKTLQGADAARLLLERIAEDENAKAVGTQNTQKAKTIPQATIKGLVGKKGYEGYTEQELIDYYKSQGYEVQ